jgi:branched-chain amino acid transport system substrate-binding protein
VTLGTAQAGAVKYKGTITIGMVLPFSGALAASGDNTLDGANVAVKQINAAGGVLGKKLVIRTLNETGVATDATNAVRELNSDKIKLQVGFALSGDCTAVGPVAASLGDLMMGTCTGDGFRSAKAYPAFWTVSTDNQDQADGAAAEMAKLNPTEVDTFAYSYTEGYSAWDDIQAVLNDDGITFTSPIQDFVSTSAPDFTTQVSAMASQLTGSSAQRVLSLLTYGGGNTLFLEEAKTYGVLPDYEGIFADGEYYDTALSLGANAPAVWDSYDYCDWQAYNNPVNNAFVKAYHAATKSYPSDWAEEGYLEMESVAKAITTAKSTTTKAVEAALGKITVTQSPVGPFTFNVATHQANVPITTCETEGNASSPAGVKLLKVVKTQIGVG